MDDRKDILERGRPAFDESKVLLMPRGKNGMREHIELTAGLIAPAFQTDMTRVVTHCLGGPTYAESQDWAKQAGAPAGGARTTPT